MPELYIETIALAPVIVALIGLAKNLGLPTKYAPWLNLALSVCGYILAWYVFRVPEALPTVTTGLNVLIMVLAAAGVYDVKQLATGRR